MLMVALLLLFNVDEHLQKINLKNIILNIKISFDYIISCYYKKIFLNMSFYYDR